VTRAPVLLDSDTLSELSRGHAKVTERARAYLMAHGRLTISAVSVFERLRGYRAALRLGKPFEAQMRQFEALAAECIVLPVDSLVADRAASIWAELGARGRNALGDILIAATASAHGLALVTRNRRDFEPMAAIEGIDVPLLDWAK
jgi:toxin FitB